MTNQRINNTEIWSKRKLLYQTAADLFIGFFFKKPTCLFIASLFRVTEENLLLERDQSGPTSSSEFLHSSRELNFRSLLVFIMVFPYLRHRRT